MDHYKILLNFYTHTYKQEQVITMNKILYFLMVGLAFAALQVVTVGAQTEDPSCAPLANGTLPPHCTGGQGDPATGDMAPAIGSVPMGAPGTAAPMGDASGMGDPSMTPPMGEHNDGPPIDPRSGQAFTQADEAKFQKYADECEATKGLLSEGSTQELVKEGFTQIQVEDLCKNGPQTAPPAQ
jgi:hypothetical protein